MNFKNKIIYIILFIYKGKIEDMSEL